jgi:hypothetical protein
MIVAGAVKNEPESESEIPGAVGSLAGFVVDGDQLH